MRPVKETPGDSLGGARAPRAVAAGRQLSRVTLHVRLEVPLLGERFAAESTRKTVLLVVRAHVRLHVALLREALAADAAREGLLLRVHAPHVGFQVSSPGKAFPARLAAKVLLARMDLHVRVHVALLREALAAHLARVGLLARVNHHVRLEVALLGEVLVAHRAQELLGGRWARPGRTAVAPRCSSGPVVRSMVVVVAVAVGALQK